MQRMTCENDSTGVLASDGGFRDLASRMDDLGHAMKGFMRICDMNRALL